MVVAVLIGKDLFLLFRFDAAQLLNPQIVFLRNFRASGLDRFHTFLNALEIRLGSFIHRREAIDFGLVPLLPCSIKSNRKAEEKPGGPGVTRDRNGLGSGPNGGLLFQKQGTGLFSAASGNLAHPIVHLAVYELFLRIQDDGLSLVEGTMRGDGLLL